MNHKKYWSIICGAMIIAFGMFNIHARCTISEGGGGGVSDPARRFLSPGKRFI